MVKFSGLVSADGGLEFGAEGLGVDIVVMLLGFDFFEDALDLFASLGVGAVTLGNRQEFCGT